MEDWQSPAGQAYRTTVALQAAALVRARGTMEHAVAMVLRYGTIMKRANRVAPEAIIPTVLRKKTRKHRFRIARTLFLSWMWPAVCFVTLPVMLVCFKAVATPHSPLLLWSRLLPVCWRSRGLSLRGSLIFFGLAMAQRMHASGDHPASRAASAFRLATMALIRAS